MGYLTNFIVYTLAMVGVMVVALFIFKSSTGSIKNGGSKYIKVLDTISIAPRKNLYIVSAGNEKFLIAGDVDRTTLISKLNTSSNECEEKISAIMTDESNSFQTNSFQDTIKTLSSKNQYMDKSISELKHNYRKNRNISDTPYTSVMKNLAERMSALNSGGNE